MSRLFHLGPVGPSIVHPRAFLWVYPRHPDRRAGPIGGRSIRGFLLSAVAATWVGAERAGASTLQTGWGSLFASSSIVLPLTGDVLQDGDIVGVDQGVTDPSVEAGVVYRITGASAFPGSSTGQTEDFVAAEARADGSYNVGASAFANRPQLREGRAGVFRSFRNDGPRTTQTFTFDIPTLGTDLQAYPGGDVGAGAIVVGTWTLSRNVTQAELQSGVIDITPVSASGTIFDYAISLSKQSVLDPVTGERTHAPPRVVFSPDLEALFGPDIFPRVNSFAGSIGGPSQRDLAFVPEFRVEWSVVVPSTYELIIDISGVAAADVNDFEMAAEGRVGDPFNPRPVADDAPVFNIGTLDLTQFVDDDPVPAPIPLPAGAWLLLGALGGLAGLRRAGRRAATPMRRGAA